LCAIIAIVYLQMSMVGSLEAIVAFQWQTVLNYHVNGVVVTKLR